MSEENKGNLRKEFELDYGEDEKPLQEIKEVEEKRITDTHKIELLNKIAMEIIGDIEKSNISEKYREIFFHSVLSAYVKRVVS